MSSIDGQSSRFSYSWHIDDNRLVDTQYLLQTSAKVTHVLGRFNGDVLYHWACLTDLLGETLTDGLVLREEIEKAAECGGCGFTGRY